MDGGLFCTPDPLGRQVVIEHEREQKNAPLNRCEGGWKWGRGDANGDAKERTERASEEENAFEHFPCRPPIAQGPALRRPLSAASD